MNAGAGYVDLVDTEDAADLGTFLARARRLGVSAVRLHAAGSVLAVTVCTSEGQGLLGEGTVLALRAFGLADPASCDVVVGVEAMQDRLARLRSTENTGPQRIVLPPVPVVVPWAGMSPPRSGWERVNTLTRETVDRVAREGIAEVSASGAGNGHDLWRKPIPDTDVPAAAALAVHALGFTAGTVAVFGHGRWRRLSTSAGHVLSR